MWKGIITGHYAVIERARILRYGEAVLGWDGWDKVESWTIVGVTEGILWNGKERNWEETHWREAKEYVKDD